MTVVVHVERRIELDIDRRHAASIAGRIDRALNEILYEVAGGKYRTLTRATNVSCRDTGTRILGHNFTLPPAL